MTTGPNAGLSEETINGIRVIRAGLANVYWHFCNSKIPTWKRAIWHLNDIYNSAMARVLEKIVLSEQPDIVNCHNLSGWSAASWGAIKKTGTPIVHVLHDLYLLCPNSNMFNKGHSCSRQCLRCRCFRLFHSKLSEAVDAVVGVSQYVLNRHLESGYFGSARIKKAILNARDLSSLSLIKPIKSNDKICFGFIGTLTPAKGIELLLKTFIEMNLADTVLFIAGIGKSEYQETLQQKFDRPNIHFIGYVRPEEFYPLIDVLVVPSIWNEALGMVIPEAFAFGVPVIGSRRGGIPEMIVNGNCGLLIDPDLPDELKAAMIRMAVDADLRSSASRKARNAAAYFLDMDRFLSSYEELFRDLCKISVR